MSDGEIALVLGVSLGVILTLVTVILFMPSSSQFAEFVCESHGLELIDYEIGNQSFSKVECGNKKPELQYDGYKVFTK